MEVKSMEFALMCPNDGRIALGLESVTAVVFHGTESVEIVFACPHCGSTLRALLPMPGVIIAAAMEVVRQLSEVDGAYGVSIDHGIDETVTVDRQKEAEVRAARERAGEPYCEYFRRQLAQVECVEDFLAEIE